MAFLLDTDVVIHLRDGELTTTDRLASLSGTLALSIIGQVELENGVYRDPHRIADRRESLRLILTRFVVLPFGEAEFAAYRLILGSIGYSKRKITDRMIAATAIAHKLTLVTMNPGDYRDIPALSLEAWTSPAA